MAAHKMGENIFKSYIWLGINENSYTSTQKKQTNLEMAKRLRTSQGCPENRNKSKGRDLQKEINYEGLVHMVIEAEKSTLCHL
jgi:hypothetical protein